MFRGGGGVNFPRTDPKCPRTGVFPYRCAPELVCSRTGVSPYRCVPVPVCPPYRCVPRTVVFPVPLCSCTSVSPYRCVLVPICPRTGVSPYRCVPVGVCVPVPIYFPFMVLVRVRVGLGTDRYGDVPEAGPIHFLSSEQY